MCGISGVVGHKDRGLIERMSLLMTHRGPDESGFYCDDRVSLGHNRLSIIDLDTGQQPLSNEDDSVFIVFNGEIYNYLELREILVKKGHYFKTNSDTETIVHAYEEHGVDCLKYLRGMFAFILWDKNKQRVLAARDRIGIKPLYYTYQSGSKTLALSSEIKPLLLLPDMEVKANFAVIQSLVQFFCNIHNETIFKSIFKLPPGHYLIYENEQIDTREYWQIPQVNSNGTLDKCNYSNKLITVLEEAVQSHLMSDVPLGATLSGGIDSSLLVALMARLTNGPIKTFTFGYGEDDPEILHSRIVAERFKTDHTEFIITPGYISEILPHIIWHLEEPVGRTEVIPNFYTYKEIAKYVKVVIVGEGADELFAGYNRFKFLTSLFPMSRNVKKDLYMKSKFACSSRTIVTKALDRTLWRNRISDSNNLINPDHIVPESRLYPELSGIFLSPKNNLLNRVLQFEQQTNLPNVELHRVDRLSMSHSIEARVPFLDNKVVEFAASTPSSLKIRNFKEKYILRQAAASILPSEIVNRPKFGQQMRFNEELSETLNGLIDEYLSPQNVKERGFFNPKSIDRMLRKKYSHHQGLKLWTALLCEVWARKFLDTPLNKALLHPES